MRLNTMSMMKRIYIFAVLLFAPSLFKYLNISFLNYEATKKLAQILRETRNKRASKGTRRNDFLQLLIDASETEKEDVANSKIHLDGDTVDAQALTFQIAGCEPTSSILSFAVYELAVHQDVQDKIRSHIKDVTKGDKLCYDHLAELDYLDAAISESLRLYTALSKIDRTCTKPYTLPGTSIKIAVGDSISIPIRGIHLDPDIYPEPEAFKPERFLREARNKIPSHLYLPFGAGPRVCIGTRFSMVILKAALVSILRNYKFSICPKTEVPLKFAKRPILLTAENGVWVHIEKI